MPSNPEGNALIPTLIVHGAAEAMELYKNALGAKELSRIMMPNSDKIMHACLDIGGTKLFMADVTPDMCPTATNSVFYLYMDDVDTACKKAVQAGMKELSSPQDMFWGDRIGSVEDRFGIRWTLATHVRDISMEDIETAKNQFCKAS